MIESEIFKLPASAYMQSFFPVYLRHKWWIVVIVVLPFIALSFFNLKFIYVSLMILFFVIPIMLGFAYFYYATGAECINTIRRCKIIIHERSFNRIIFDDEDNEVTRIQYNTADYITHLSDTQILLINKQKYYDIHIIPLSSFENKDIFLEAAKLLSLE